MVSASKKNENQHYVPQFLLKNFSFAKKKGKEFHIHAYDKHTDNIFTPNISGIASERGFYNFYIGDNDRSLEPALSFLESQTRKAIQKIVETEDLNSLTESERSWLALFVAIQFMRVKKQREITKKFIQDMVEHFQKSGLDYKDLQYFCKTSEDDIKIRTIKSFVENSPAIADLIENKIWMIFKFPNVNPLYISDHPVVMHNDENFGPYGNIGFAVPAIQIYLPIKSDLALGFWCPSIFGKIKENQNELEKAMQNIKAQITLNPNFDRDHANKIMALAQYEKAKPAKFLDAIKSRTPVQASDDQVTFMNSLQVHWSHRFVMCKRPEFDLVKRMISDNEKYRTGITVGIN